MIEVLFAPVILLAAIAFAVRLTHWIRVRGTDPATARELRTSMLFRLLLTVGLALGLPRIYFFVDGLLGVPSLPQLVLGLCSVGLVTCYLLGPLPNRPPTISSRYAASPWVTEYQLIVMAFFSLTTGVLFWLGARYRRHAARGPLRTALRLVQIGSGLAALSLLHRLVVLQVLSAGGTLPWHESGVDGVQIYLITPALLCILAGIATLTWGPRLSAWRRRRRWYRTLRPLWTALYRTDREIALLPPRPEWVEALTVTRVGFRLQRRVVEIRDVLIGPLRGYLDPAVLDRAKEMAAGSPDRAAVAEAACIAAALRAREQNMAPRRDSASPLHTATTDLDGEAAWLAAVSQALRPGAGGG